MGLPRLAVAHGNAEHFSVAEGFVAIGLPRSGCRSLPPRPVKPPACSAQTAVEVGGVEEDVRVAGVVQRPAQKSFHLHTCAPGRCDLPPIWRCRWRRPRPPQMHQPCGWRCHLCRPPSPRRRGPCRPGGVAQANLEISCPASVTPTDKPCGYGMARLMSPTWVVSSRWLLPLRWVAR